jgi:hypothetical protein
MCVCAHVALYNAGGKDTPEQVELWFQGAVDDLSPWNEPSAMVARPSGTMTETCGVRSKTNAIQGVKPNGFRVDPEQDSGLKPNTFCMARNALRLGACIASHVRSRGRKCRRSRREGRTLISAWFLPGYWWARVTICLGVRTVNAG